MKAHELAKKLLEMPDLPVFVQSEAYYDCSYQGEAEFVKQQWWTRNDEVITINQTDKEQL